MSATELIAEKSRTLTAPQAEVVLAFIDQVAIRPAPTATELRKLPREARKRILAEQMERAAELYRLNPDLIVEDFDPPLEYA